MSYVTMDEDIPEGIVDRFLNPNPEVRAKTGYKVVQLKPYEKPYGDIKAFQKAVNENLWITSDLHITADLVRTNKLLTMINKVVSPSDNLLILGDLHHKKYGDFKHTKDFVKSLNTKNIFLILGNHDMYTLNYFADMGFLYISDKVCTSCNGQKIMFTHAPEPVGKNTINIHGHLHGSNDYWYFSNLRHYDVWIPWTPEYIYSHKTSMVPADYPAIQQLGDLLRYYAPDKERGVQ